MALGEGSVAQLQFSKRCWDWRSGGPVVTTWSARTHRCAEWKHSGKKICWPTLQAAGGSSGAAPAVRSSFFELTPSESSSSSSSSSDYHKSPRVGDTRPKRMPSIRRRALLTCTAPFLACHNVFSVAFTPFGAKAFGAAGVAGCSMAVGARRSHPG